MHSLDLLTVALAPGYPTVSYVMAPVGCLSDACYWMPIGCLLLDACYQLLVGCLRSDTHPMSLLSDADWMHLGCLLSGAYRKPLDSCRMPLRSDVSRMRTGCVRSDAYRMPQLSDAFRMSFGYLFSDTFQVFAFGRLS